MTTDDAGTFALRDAPFGRLDVIVLADGYQAYFGSARAGGELAIRLVGEAGASEVIHVSGQRPGGPPLHPDTEEIRNLPGAGNDALRALQSLPGVARTPFGLGGLALRGTAPRDTKAYLDGIEVPLLYHFGGLASFLATEAVDELTLEPGGASVRYGRGLGGVAVVTSRTGRGDGWRAGGEVDHAVMRDGAWVADRRAAAVRAAAGIRPARSAARSPVAAIVGCPRPLHRRPERQQSRQPRGRHLQLDVHPAQLHHRPAGVSLDRPRVHPEGAGRCTRVPGRVTTSA